MQLLAAVWRTFVLYGVILLVMRAMGKREVGHLSPFDLVVAIMIAELAAIPIEQPRISIFQGLVPILILAGLQIALAKLSLWNIRARSLISGVPSVVVARGQVVEPEMRRLNYNLNDLLAQLRDKGHFCLSEVDWAMVECSGKLSVVPKADQRPVVASDLGVSTGSERMPLALVLDGYLDRPVMRQAGVTEEQLLTKARELGGQRLSDILFAGTDRQGRLYLQLKEKRRRGM
ncbi:MAG: DUF421 domain-containing protein [bacterium]|nr:DUF421 domain-containing protein [bacterium]